MQLFPAAQPGMHDLCSVAWEGGHFPNQAHPGQMTGITESLFAIPWLPHSVRGAYAHTYIRTYHIVKRCICTYVRTYLCTYIHTYHIVKRPVKGGHGMVPLLLVWVHITDANTGLKRVGSLPTYSTIDNGQTERPTV